LTGVARLLLIGAMAERIRAVTLDLFDTVVDLHFDRLPALEMRGRRVPSTLGQQHALLRDRGHAHDLETFAAALFDSDRELGESHLKQGLEVPTMLRFERLAERLGIIDEGLAAALTRTHMAGIASVAEAPAHHAAALGSLASLYRLGLCSNFSHAETALAILERAELRGHFSAFAISETTRYRKPRREIFEALLAELGVSPGEAVHVGDRLPDDVDGAAAVGMRSVWLTRRVRDPEKTLREHPGARPTWIASDLGELAAILEAGV
jgi:putative hydrolase of the HAD superfamily